MLADIVLIGIMFSALLLTILFLCQCFVVVPYVPTPWSVVREMIDMAELRGDETVYDLGAGDARLLSLAARRHPDLVVKGFEIIPTVWLLGKFRLWRNRQHAAFHCRDFFGQNLQDADVIFLYLLPSTMAALEKKFDAELSPGTRVISHGFRFPHATPIRERRVEGRRPKNVYVYRW